MPSNDSRQSAKPTVVDRIVDEIRSGIREGRYVPGQRLVEADLTEALDVSRGPLREAMWRLAGERLLTVRSNRGAMVRAMSREEALDVYQVRETLEGLAASLAAKNIGKGDNLAQFKKMWKRIDAAHKGAQASEYATLNEQFHGMVIKLADNEELGLTINQLRLPLVRFQFRSRVTTADTDKGHADHERVYQAIIDGNAARAERAMRKHVRNSWKLINALPDSAFL